MHKTCVLSSRVDTHRQGRWWVAVVEGFLSDFQHPATKVYLTLTIYQVRFTF